MRESKDKHNSDRLWQHARPTLTAKDEARLPSSRDARDDRCRTRERQKGLVSYSFHIHERLPPRRRAVLLNMLADIRRVLSQFMPSLIATTAELRKPRS